MMIIVSLVPGVFVLLAGVAAIVPRWFVVGMEVGFNRIITVPAGVSVPPAGAAAIVLLVISLVNRKSV